MTLFGALDGPRGRMLKTERFWRVLSTFTPTQWGSLILECNGDGMLLQATRESLRMLQATAVSSERLQNRWISR